jgi:RNA polymerase sigma-70 factor, ECF subfamily
VENGDESSDETLVQEVLAGRERAFLELYRRHRRYVLTLVVRTSGRQADAEDLVQECFVQMHRALGSFGGRARFRTWFHGIIVRVCHSSTRARLAQKRRGDSDAVEMDDILLETIPSPEDHGTKSREMRDWIQPCLDKLGIAHRLPLVLHIFSQLEHAEIARVLAIPEGSVKSRLFNARQRMAKCLDAQGGE